MCDIVRSTWCVCTSVCNLSRHHRESCIRCRSGHRRICWICVYTYYISVFINVIHYTTHSHPMDDYEYLYCFLEKKNVWHYEEYVLMSWEKEYENEKYVMCMYKCVWFVPCTHGVAAVDEGSDTVCKVLAWSLYIIFDKKAL